MSPQGAEGGSSIERFGKQVLAVLVLLIAAWIIIKVFLIHIVAFLFFVILAIAAIIALIWAIRVLF